MLLLSSSNYVPISCASFSLKLSRFDLLLTIIEEEKEEEAVMIDRLSYPK